MPDETLIAHGKKVNKFNAFLISKIGGPDTAFEEKLDQIRSIVTNARSSIDNDHYLI